MASVEPTPALYDALKPMHDDLREALDHLRQMGVSTETPPALIESMEERRKSAYALVERVERVLHGLRVDDYVETVRAAAAEPLPDEDPERAAKIAACPEPFWHETHRYCPTCPWTEADEVPTS